MYVFDKNQFELRDGIEWKATRAVRPIGVFRTRIKDLKIPVNVNKRNADK